MSAMNLMDMLLNGQGQQSAMQAGQQAGLDGNQTKMAMAALLPALSGALKREAASPEGLQKLMGAVQQGDHSRYIDDPSAMDSASTTQDGNAILGHLFGSKDMSRAVAERASEQTGLDTGALKRLLPLAATMVMGSLGKQSRQPGMGDMLMGLAGGGAGGGLGSMIGNVLGSGGSTKPAGGGAMGMLNTMLDADGDGSAMDDLFKKFTR